MSALFLKQVQAAADSMNYEQALGLCIDHFSCASGTLHFLGDEMMGDQPVLELASQRGLPEVLLDIVARIPVGKGMAGYCAERKETVQVCNLQQDTSGVAKPGAKLTQMEGCIATPLLRNGELVGVLGIAKPTVYEYSGAEISLLEQAAAVIAEAVSQK